LGISLVAVPINIQAAGTLVTDPDFIDNKFEGYIVQPCLDGLFALINRGWKIEEITQYNDDICTKIFNAGTFDSSGGTDAYGSSSNIGSVAAQSKTSDSIAQQQASSVKDRLDEIQEEEVSSGAWGFLLSVQSGETERVSTDNESGYDSELDGVVLGIDYRFNDKFVVGIAAGKTSDDARYDNNGGSLKTDSTSRMLYATYVINDNAYVDAYVGRAPLEFSNSRRFGITGFDSEFDISGEIRGDFEGEQSLRGISGGYDWHIGDNSVGVFAALDNSETDVDGYAEQGATGLEMLYPDQTTKSSLRTIGVNASRVIDLGWAAVIPNISVASVHQSENDSRSFDARLQILPDVDTTTLTLESDNPDRNYILTSLGVVLATNGGTQYFLNYEKMSSNDFLETWALSAGVLAEF
jgi:outer membrane autotransporter protein